MRFFLLLPVFVAVVSAQNVPAGWTCAFDGEAARAAEPEVLFDAPAGRITVPVVFHIVHADDGLGDLPDAWITAQMDTLNDAFERLSPTPSQRFSFRLLGVHRIRDTGLFTNTLNVLTALDTQNRVDPNHVMNVDVGDNPGGVGGGALGLGAVGGHRFVYVRWRGFAGYPTPNGPSEGGSLVHEVGHFLGLLHTFGLPSTTCPPPDAPASVCVEHGDMVCDTAPSVQSGPANPPCDEAWNTCVDHSGPGGTDAPDPIHNYMNYTLDLCWTHFTTGQLQRMRAYTFEFGHDIVVGDGRTAFFGQNLTIPENHRWTFYDGTLRFAAGTSIEVSGQLSSSGTTFTAADDAAGWSGIRFLAGSGGTMRGITSVERVGGFKGRAVSVTNASPTFDEVTIRYPLSSGNVTGLYVTGPQAYPLTRYLTVEGMTGDGVVLNDRATIHLAGGQIRGNAGAGLAAGYKTQAFLYPPLGPTERYRGGTITLNQEDGVSASASATVVFGYGLYSHDGGEHNDGFVSVVTNTGVGLRASGAAALYAGGAATWQRNRFFRNTGLDAQASGKDTRAYLRCNWWDDTSPPFRTAATSGATLDDSYWLDDDPYLVPAARCSNGTFTAGRAAAPGEAARGGDADTLEDVLADALALGDQPAVAVAALAQIVADAPDAPEAAAALAETATFANKTDASATVLALLADVAAAGPNATLQSTARRSLVRAHHVRGDLPAALAATEALLVAPVGDEDVLAAHTARVYLLWESGQPGEAQSALAALETLAPESADAVMAREYLEAVHLGAGRAMAPASVAVAPLDAVTAEGETAEALRVHPNPSAGTATVSFALAEAAGLRLTVHDVLGREVAVLADGRWEAGPHRVSLDASALAPGVYVVRAATAVAVQTRAFTVAR